MYFVAEILILNTMEKNKTHNIGRQKLARVRAQFTAENFVDDARIPFPITVHRRVQSVDQPR